MGGEISNIKKVSHIPKNNNRRVRRSYEAIYSIITVLLTDILKPTVGASRASR